MTIDKTDEPTLQGPLRLWPGVVIVTLQWVAWVTLPLIDPEWMAYGVICGFVGGLGIAIWWLFFSRAPWAERVGAIVLMVVLLLVASRFVHKSIANGMMGMLLPIYSIPVLSLALVAWAVASRRFSNGLRWASMVATILLVCGGWTLVRTGGMTGDADSDFNWRWAATPEERLLAETADEPAVLPAAPAASETPDLQPAAPVTEEPATPLPATPVEAKAGAGWPGFRGLRRDGIVRGTRIKTDWTASPPVELWRHPVGPGWSSFSVRGDLIYTQEQRGQDEVVDCYSLSTGKLVWRHRDAARFWESNAGAGPRGTPTLSKGRVYTLGATGLLNVLDAGNGAVKWSRNAASDTGMEVPEWGFASSPLIFGDMVVIATAGKLVAYDLATGKPRWFGPDGRSGYSSPQLMTIGGVQQILLVSGAGVTGVAPTDGKLLWEHKWPGDGIVQPALTAEGDVLIGTGSGLGSGAGIGMRRLSVRQGAGEWTVEERWTSNGLKPYYNDFVVNKGHAFGFDGSILACIDLADGKRKWKGGRYGHGQMLLLPDQDLLLVLSEEGEIALVKATPDQFTELARFPALEGKTWNHPVLVSDLLLARNGELMAAFRLPVDGQ